MTPTLPPPSLSSRYGARYRWLLLLSVMVGMMASIMSSTIVNVAIPGMSHHFALGQERAQWVSSGFMVAMTVSMLTTPWLLARYGYRRTYVGTMVLLMAGGIAGGLANHFPLVLAARVAEGLAAGVVQPIPAIIILRAFEPHEQGRASGIFGMGVVLAPAIGPSIGGVLVDLFGWRSIFFMVVPLLPRLDLAGLQVRADHRTGRRGGRAQQRRSTGADCSLGTVGTLVPAQRPGRAARRCAAAGRGAAGRRAARAFGAFIALAAAARGRGRRAADEPGAVPAPRSSRWAAWSPSSTAPRCSARPTCCRSTCSSGCSCRPRTSAPSCCRRASCWRSPSPASAGWPTGSPTWLLVSIGLALLAASFALMLVLRLDSALWLLVAFAAIGRVGLGFILPSLNLGSMRPLAKPLIPQGASAINFLRMLGGAAGVSLCAIVLEWRLAAHGDSLANPATSPARLAAFDEVFAMLAAPVRAGHAARPGSCANSPRGDAVGRTMTPCASCSE